MKNRVHIKADMCKASHFGIQIGTSKKPPNSRESSGLLVYCF